MSVQKGSKMNLWDAQMRRKALKVSAVLLAFAAFFFVGASVGTVCGSSMAVQRQGLDATYTMAILRSLHDGKTESAVDLLETKLNTEIFLCTQIEKLGPSIFDVSAWINGREKSMEHVSNTLSMAADYRSAHPYPYKHSEIETMVEDALSKYKEKT